MCVCVCVRATHERYSDLRMKQSKKVKICSSLQLRVEDEGRLEVPESPLHTVWEGWMMAGWGIQVE